MKPLDNNMNAIQEFYDESLDSYYWYDLGGRLFECEVCSVWPFAGRVGCLSLHSYLQNPATRARV